MPRRGSTWPNVLGPLTGRKMGNCSRGFGYGQGIGRNQVIYQESKETLIVEKEILLNRLKSINEKLEDK
ncbi:MAG: DUF5320 domain-containing protein [Candidatus Izemoplasmatales bacterium]|nr:DUF5320 domain-containing protein [Candidatus Izemoplasmatales bacterium]